MQLLAPALGELHSIPEGRLPATWHNARHTCRPEPVAAFVIFIRSSTLQAPAAGPAALSLLLLLPLVRMMADPVLVTATSWSLSW
jgi:hypothetical protein